MAPPFTPKLFRQHLDYLQGKRHNTSPVSQPVMGSCCNNTIPPTHDSMSPRDDSPSTRKRKAEIADLEESISKRAHVGSEETQQTVNGQLVPVISRRETNAQLGLAQNHHACANTARDDESEDEFLDAEEDVSYSTRGPFTQVQTSTGAGGLDMGMGGVDDSGLGAWRASQMDPSSTLLSDQIDGDLEGMSLFPELGAMGSFALDGDDIAVDEPEYGQEGIDDGRGSIPDHSSEALNLGAGRASEAPEIQPDDIPVEVHGDGFLDLTDADSKDDANEPDLDAFIAEANGTRPYAKPLEDEPISEAAVEDVEVAFPPGAPNHIEDENGVHRLFTQDGQIDAFIVKTGTATESVPQSHASPGSDGLEPEAQEYPLSHSFPSGAHDSNVMRSSGANFASSFGQAGLEIVGCNDSALAEHYEAQDYTYQRPSKRIATPPPPTTLAAPAPSTSNSNSQTQILLPDGSTCNVSKTNASTSALRTTEFAKLAGTDSPILPRDLSKSLEPFHSFHTRALEHMPSLPTPLPSRRYWIAVFYPSKKPKNAKSEKDFMWMKGNKFSTISTIWHNFSLRTMEEDFVLTCRGEVLDMKVMVQELDWFNNKFVVLRAVKRDSMGMAKGLFDEIGVVPEKEVEVVDLLGED
ncbi:hypothetical protein CERZMDRAFT_106509 [Cercospora zeae-maydis SCOH1-5]|uniref:Uncharacterized protein n=1 Tax=Cercospora zeae-maydis SCOH1-5 TaxID=717836 RepID=A0A6A6FD71_9PEZI|nr:hypothetical protein CERZMDRAFT_106509 [Cercospora zeae-maydis SCOH1-5]